MDESSFSSPLPTVPEVQLIPPTKIRTDDCNQLKPLKKKESNLNTSNLTDTARKLRSFHKPSPPSNYQCSNTSDTCNNISRVAPTSTRNLSSKNFKDSLSDKVDLSRLGRLVDTRKSLIKRTDRIRQSSWKGSNTPSLLPISSSSTWKNNGFAEKTSENSLRTIGKEQISLPNGSTINENAKSLGDGLVNSLQPERHERKSSLLAVPSDYESDSFRTIVGSQTSSKNSLETSKETTQTGRGLTPIKQHSLSYHTSLTAKAQQLRDEKNRFRHSFSSTLLKPPSILDERLEENQNSTSHGTSPTLLIPPSIPDERFEKIENTTSHGLINMHSNIRKDVDPTPLAALAVLGEWHNPSILHPPDEKNEEEYINQGINGCERTNDFLLELGNIMGDDVKSSMSGNPPVLNSVSTEFTVSPSQNHQAPKLGSTTSSLSSLGSESATKFSCNKFKSKSQDDMGTYCDLKETGIGRKIRSMLLWFILALFLFELLPVREITTTFSINLKKRLGIISKKNIKNVINSDFDSFQSAVSYEIHKLIKLFRQNGNLTIIGDGEYTTHNEEIKCIYSTKECIYSLCSHIIDNVKLQYSSFVNSFKKINLHEIKSRSYSPFPVKFSGDKPDEESLLIISFSRILSLVRPKVEDYFYNFHKTDLTSLLFSKGEKSAEQLMNPKDKLQEENYVNNQYLSSSHRTYYNMKELVKGEHLCEDESTSTSIYSQENEKTIIEKDNIQNNLQENYVQQPFPFFSESIHFDNQYHEVDFYAVEQEFSPSNRGENVIETESEKVQDMSDERQLSNKHFLSQLPLSDNLYSKVYTNRLAHFSRLHKEESRDENYALCCSLSSSIVVSLSYHKERQQCLLSLVDEEICQHLNFKHEPVVKCDLKSQVSKKNTKKDVKFVENKLLQIDQNNESCEIGNFFQVIVYHEIIYDTCPIFPEVSINKDFTPGTIVFSLASVLCNIDLPDQLICFSIQLVLSIWKQHGQSLFGRGIHHNRESSIVSQQINKLTSIPFWNHISFLSKRKNTATISTNLMAVTEISKDTITVSSESQKSLGGRKEFPSQYDYCSILNNISGESTKHHWLSAQINLCNTLNDGEIEDFMDSPIMETVSYYFQKLRKK